MSFVCKKALGVGAHPTTPTARNQGVTISRSSFFCITIIDVFLIIAS